eukprot:TRINITY_DN6759_c0_g1_i2.p1 TRINITY_DN6759_c0_g1~~TRINITY_DN6759_c0_g1_i2.p1  ORF type:complete len:293 (+),score=22.27 TRINITY_DN6759_c0_g1_i2:114-992(+)
MRLPLASVGENYQRSFWIEASHNMITSIAPRLHRQIYFLCAAYLSTPASWYMSPHRQIDDFNDRCKKVGQSCPIAISLQNVARMSLLRQPFASSRWLQCLPVLFFCTLVSAQQPIVLLNAYQPTTQRFDVDSNRKAVGELPHGAFWSIKERSIIVRRQGDTDPFLVRNALNSDVQVVALVNIGDRPRTRSINLRPEAGYELHFINTLPMDMQLHAFAELEAQHNLAAVSIIRADDVIADEPCTTFQLALSGLSATPLHTECVALNANAPNVIAIVANTDHPLASLSLVHYAP